MRVMDVILLERIEKLGKMGDIVKVKPGYARNFLLPQRKALRANKDNLAYFERQRVQLEALNLKRRDEAQEIADRMRGLSVVMVRQAGEAGQLYGSVSGHDIAEAVKEAGFTVARSQVHLDVPIKALGQFPIKVALHPEVSVTVRVIVARTQDEAQRALAAAEQPAEAPAEETGVEEAAGEDTSAE